MTAVQRVAARGRSIAAAVVVAVMATGCSVIGGGGGSYELVAEFSRTINLFETSQVRVLGLPAGTITDIEVDGDRVRVTLAIDDDVPVPADVQATVVPFSLIGERYVQLFPAWIEGQPRASDGDVIPLARTTVPVEPDEALAALKELLDTLDAEGTGRLVKNLGAALDGQGPALNGALEHLGTLLTTFADESDEVGAIIDQFDEFTATLVTRESQLGEVMDSFASATATLAAERASIEALVKGLAALSGDALDLVAQHDTALARDLEVVGRLLRSADVHLDRVVQVLDAGPVLVTGLRDAYSPEFHRLDLRNQASPTVSQAFDLIDLPVPSICLPIDVDCTVEVPSPPVTRPSSPSPAAQHDDARPTSTDATPIDALVSLLASRAPADADAGAVSGDLALGAVASAPEPSTPWWGRLARTMLGVA